jgi:hypothetical protein
MEGLLQKLTPRRAPPQLRDTVLADVQSELHARRKRWDRWALPAAAALLALAVGFSYWVTTSTDRRIARLYGPEPTPHAINEIADAVTSVAGADAGQSVRRGWLAAARRARPMKVELPDMRALLVELELASEGRTSVEIEKGSEMDGAQRDRSDRNSSYRQRGPQLDRQFAA